MKKLLLSFLPVLLAMTAFTAKAQGFSATVTWDNPGAIKVLRGSRPSKATPVEIDPNATSYKVTEKDDFMFIPTENFKLQAINAEGVTPAPKILYMDDVYFFKLDAAYGSAKYNGKTVALITEELVYSTSFNLDVANGADRIKFQLMDADGNTTRTITPVKGNQNIKLSQYDKKLYMTDKSFPASEFFKATKNDEAIPYTNFSYTTDIANNDNVYVAFDNPSTTKECEVKFVFANNNPDCLSNIFNATTSSFILPEDLASSNYTIKLESGTQIKINLKEDAEYIFNSITPNPMTGVDAATIQNHVPFTILDNVTLTIDVTSQVIEDVTATLYTNDINGVSFTQKYGDPTTALTTTEKGTHDANSLGTVFPAGATIDIPTTEYTINGISGKENRFFFEPKEGYWVKEAIVANREKQAGDPADYYRITGTLIDVKECPVFLNVHKIDYTTPAVIYYEGSTDCNTAVTASTPDGETAPFQGQLSTLPQGYSKIMFDPEYNATFSARFMANSETATSTGSFFTYADGKPVAASTDSEALFNGIKLGKNSVLKLFYGTAAPKEHTLNFIVEEGAGATVTYDEIVTTDDFTNPITNVGTVKYTFAPAEGTEILVNGTALAAPYEFTPAAGATEIKIAAKKVELPKLTYTVTPEDGATVKTLSKVTLTIGFTPEMINGEESLDFAENAAELIKIEKDGKNVPVAGYIEQGIPTETEVPIVFSLEAPITEAGDYTITISEGLVFTTKWDEATEGFIRDTNSAVNEAKTIKVTVDPSYKYKWSFDPENGSEKNPLPDPEGEGQFIYISLPEADSLSPDSFDLDSNPETPTSAGPWLTYNGTPLTKMDEEYNGDWEVGYDWNFWGQPILRIIVNASVFTTPGELTIRADEGAFTVNGNEPSPAFEYSASFGEKKNYTVTFTPAADTEVKAEDIRTITVTFNEAQTVALNEFYGVFSQGMNSVIMLNSDNVSIEGNKVTVTLPESYEVTHGNASLLLGENSFLLDGNQNSPDVEASWTVARTTPVSFEWEASPSTAVVNEGYGMNVAFMFNEYETVSVLDKTAIAVEFGGEKLGALNYDDLSKIGYDMMAGSGDYPNALMFTVAGGALENKETEGELKVTIPAGAIAVSGETSTEEITYTWKLVKAKEYTVKVTPANGETVASISKFTLEFTDAESVELFHQNFTLRDENYNFYEVDNVFPYGAASHPTFDINLANPATAAGTYTFQIMRGAFTIDGIYESPAVEVVVKVDPSYQGISEIFGDAANGKFTVINLQGIVVMKDASAEELKTLSTGIYIINGKKVSIK